MEKEIIIIYLLEQQVMHQVNILEETYISKIKIGINEDSKCNNLLFFIIYSKMLVLSIKVRGNKL